MLALFYVPSPPIPVSISPVLSLPMFIILSHTSSPILCPNAASCGLLLGNGSAENFQYSVAPMAAMHYKFKKIDHSNNYDNQSTATTPSTSSISFVDQSEGTDRTPDARDSAPDKSDTQAAETYQCRSLSSKPQSQTTAPTGPSTSPSRSRPFPISSAVAPLSSVFLPPNFIPS